MKRTPLFLAALTLLTAAGWWFARSNGSRSSRLEALVPNRLSTQSATSTPGQRLRPPDPSRRFIDFTPEQRVEFARKGSGPGG